MATPRLIRHRITRWLTILAIAFGVVAMNQLSAGHVAAIPATSASMSPSMPMVHMAPQTIHHPVGGHAMNAPASYPDDSPLGQVTRAEPTGLDGGCAGCGEHDLMMFGCLAALTLLVVAWTVPLLRRRWTLPAAHPGQPDLTSALRRWQRRPLRLTELSISRT